MTSKADRNFDDLAPRFARNIYGSLKGRLRLAVLESDFAQHLPALSRGEGWSVLDAGAGQGHFSLSLAQQGSRVTLCDHSANMLTLARQRWQAMESVACGQVAFVNRSLQALGGDQQYDLVLGHALLEWMADPVLGFDLLCRRIKPGGYLSVIVYNAHGLAFKNLLRGNFRKFDRHTFSSFRGSLTPISPLTPEWLQEHGEQAGLSLACHSGIRVFHDYILDPALRNLDEQGLMLRELEYSRLDPYRQMARYTHMLFKSTRSDGDTG